MCIGGQGASGDYTGVAAGGYNGGGSGGKGSSSYRGGSGGGGATHIATTNRGVLSNYNSYRSEVLIVAGGGGGKSVYGSPGSGGGLSGGTGYITHDKYPNAGGSSGGTQTSGYAFGKGCNGANGDKSNNAHGNSGAGGGWYGGYAYTWAVDGGAGGGGSGYIGGVPSFSYNGATYSPSTSNGVNGGNGSAKITYVAKTLSVSLPPCASYTERNHYAISASVKNTASYKWQITDSTGKWVDLYSSKTGILTGNIPAGLEDVSFTNSLSSGNGTITISGTVKPGFDGKKLRAVATDSSGTSVTADILLQVTSVSCSHKTVVGQVGQVADFYFTVHGAKSVALQVCAYGSDIWENYMPADGVVNNPITTTARDGRVTFHFGSLKESDLKKYYRIVLTNDGSGLVSDGILLTSCIYNLYYDGNAAETIYYDGEEVNAVYYNTGTDQVLVYGFE